VAERTWDVGCRPSRLRELTATVMARSIVAVFVVALLVCACGDSADTIAIDGQRYGGSAIPLVLDGVELVPLGVVEQATNSANIGRPLFALPGVDPDDVVVAQRFNPNSELGPFTTYISQDATGRTLADRGMCPYVPSAPGCEPPPS